MNISPAPLKRGDLVKVFGNYGIVNDVYLDCAKVIVGKEEWLVDKKAMKATGRSMMPILIMKDRKNFPSYNDN